MVTGRVLSVQGDIHTFATIIRQNTTQSPIPGRLRVRALMGLNSDWRFATRPMPSCNRNVSFTGQIAAFEDGVVVVVVDGITHLPLGADGIAVLRDLR